MINYNDLMNMIGNLENVEHQARIVIEINDPRNIFEFAKNVEGAPVEELAKAIIKIKNPEYIYKFARYVKGAPIDKLTDAILNTNNFDYIRKFVRFVKGAPIDKITKFIIATKDAETIYSCTFCFVGKKNIIDKLADAIIATKDAEYIIRFANYIKGAPIEKLAKAIIKIDYRDGNFFYNFMLEVKDAPIDTMADIVIKKGYICLIDKLLYFSETREKYFNKIITILKNNNAIEKIIVVVMNYIQWGCCLGESRKKIIDDCCNEIIKMGNAEYIYELAFSIEWALNRYSSFRCGYKPDGLEEYSRYIKENLISKLTNEIIATNDIKYIYRFLFNIKDAPTDNLLIAIMSINDLEYIDEGVRFINDVLAGAKIENFTVVCSTGHKMSFPTKMGFEVFVANQLNEKGYIFNENFKEIFIQYCENTNILLNTIHTIVSKSKMNLDKIKHKTIKRPKVNTLQEPKRYVKKR